MDSFITVEAARRELLAKRKWTAMEWHDIKVALASIPSADVAPVVWCKDCKHSYEDLGGLTCSHGVCVDSIVTSNFYCADGERRE